MESWNQNLFHIGLSSFGTRFRFVGGFRCLCSITFSTSRSFFFLFFNFIRFVRHVGFSLDACSNFLFRRDNNVWGNELSSWSRWWQSNSRRNDGRWRARCWRTAAGAGIDVYSCCSGWVSIVSNMMYSLHTSRKKTKISHRNKKFYD